MIYKADFKDISWVLSEHGEFPAFYSDTACKIISEKYFTKGETSLFDMVKRVVEAIAERGFNDGYFDSPTETGDFERRLAGYIINQHVSFNSPVWFNLGVEDEPQCSACFIQSVEDSIDGISDLARKEAKLFKHGSGTGTNFSALRAKGAALSKGGVSSGPLAFMQALDANAGAIKSGGKTRRSAKMNLMDCDHPDIEEFIWSKALEDRKAKWAIERGKDPLEAYEDVAFQNGNHSVRLTDKFMKEAVQLHQGPSWQDDRLDDIAQACWECGDPGVQFTDTINRANPCPDKFTINASNPCSEFLFCDESACNLASIKLSEYTVNNMREITQTLIMAMDIIVSLSSYPTDEIEWNSKHYRPLGLGYTNLGAYLMEIGYHYDTNAARSLAEQITADMHFHAVGQSRELARKLGSHWDTSELPQRNAQLTLLAPTGTISFMMDCLSTGIEPVFAPRIFKVLSDGGGTIDYAPSCIDNAKEEHRATAVGEYAISPLAHLDMMAAVQPHLDGAISKTVNLHANTLVADIRQLIIDSWDLGLKCVAFYRDGSKGVQPLKEKPVHPLDVTDDPAFRQGAHEVMRGHSGKPLTKETLAEAVDNLGETYYGKSMTELLTTERYMEPASPHVAHLAKTFSNRVKLPATRDSITHKFQVGGTEGYLTVGLYDEDSPGEIFLTVSKQGSTMGGMVDAWATAFSMCLQYGVPLKKLCAKYKGVRFEPSGFTGADEVKVASSIVDYVAQWLEGRFLTEREPDFWDMLDETPDVDWVAPNGDMCGNCGTMMIQTGSCKACPACANSTGGCG